VVRWFWKTAIQRLIKVKSVRRRSFLFLQMFPLESNFSYYQMKTLSKTDIFHLVCNSCLLQLFGMSCKRWLRITFYGMSCKRWLRIKHFGARFNIAFVSGYPQKIAQFWDIILRVRNNFMAVDIQNFVVSLQMQLLNSLCTLEGDAFLQCTRIVRLEANR